MVHRSGVNKWGRESDREIHPVVEVRTVNRVVYELRHGP